MSSLPLHEVHREWGARFTTVNGVGMIAHYGDFLAEYAALRAAAVVLDLSGRSRLCLLGADRERLLHGQVTNNVKALAPGDGCYAALVTAKGRLESDLNIHRLDAEFLLDFEPGYSAAVARRLERFVIADDVQVVDVAPLFGLLSVQGPRAAEIVTALNLPVALPATPLRHVHTHDPRLGHVYVMNQPRVGLPGFDLFVPVTGLEPAARNLVAAARGLGGQPGGWEALELARVEAGLPRFGQDMDETTLAPEAGIEARAISYAKGCYIGQEVIARIRTYGRVARALRGLRLADGLAALPVTGDKLFRDGREVGYVTSAVRSPLWGANLALGYVRRESNQVGTELRLQSAAGESPALIVPLPFSGASATG